MKKGDKKSFPTNYKNLEDILVKLELLNVQKAPKKKRGRPKKNNVE
jgi:hypothetical protein